MRTLVLILFVIGAVGTVADLLLIGHVEDTWQLAPVAVLACGAVAGIGAGAVGSAALIRLFQTTAVLLIATGTIGLWLHWGANSEFEREMSPDLTGAAFVWKALHGAAPPSAAPGTLIHLGLLGLVYAWRHPAFKKGDTR
jgi:hypothetical protein